MAETLYDSLMTQCKNRTITININIKDQRRAEGTRRDMAVAQEWNGSGMGLDAHSAAVNAVNGPAIRRRFIDGSL